MTDLTKGIIEIDGFTFTPDTKLNEVIAFFGDKARLVHLSIGPRVKFCVPFYLTSNIYACNFDFDKDGNISEIGLVPEPPKDMIDDGNGNRHKAMLEISKKWLKDNITGEPTSEGRSSILFEYDWGFLRAAVSNDMHYGLIGGEISIVYRW